MCPLLDSPLGARRSERRRSLFPKLDHDGAKGGGVICLCSFARRRPNAGAPGWRNPPRPLALLRGARHRDGTLHRICPPQSRLQLREPGSQLQWLPSVGLQVLQCKCVPEPICAPPAHHPRHPPPMRSPTLLTSLGSIMQVDSAQRNIRGYPFVQPRK